MASTNLQAPPGRKDAKRGGGAFSQDMEGGASGSSGIMLLLANFCFDRHFGRP